METETNHSMFSEEAVPCAQCGSVQTHRVPQAVGVTYATEGFYHIDSGKRFESQLSNRGKQIWERKKAELNVR